MASKVSKDLLQFWSKSEAKGFYTPRRLLNTDYSFLFSHGSRNSGKTFGWAYVMVMEYAVKNNRKFILMRRKSIELDTIKETYFDGVSKETGVDISVKGTDIRVEGVQMGKCIALHQYGNYKSIDMSDYDIIVFDEFLPEDGGYLKINDFTYEPTACLNFYQSLARGHNRPIREEVKFVFLSNSISTFNPYSSYFKFDKELAMGRTFFKDTASGFYAVESYENKRINDQIAKTPFGKFIQGTPYGEYALGNNYRLDDYSLVRSLTPQHKPFLLLSYNDTKYMLSLNIYDASIIISKPKKLRNDLKTYSVFNGEAFPCIFNTPYYIEIRKRFNHAKLYATDQETVFLLNVLGAKVSTVKK